MADAKPFTDEEKRILDALSKHGAAGVEYIEKHMIADRKRIEELENTRLGRVCPTCAKQTVNPKAWCDLLLFEENEQQAVTIERLECNDGILQEIITHIERAKKKYISLQAFLDICKSLTARQALDRKEE